MLALAQGLTEVDGCDGSVNSELGGFIFRLCGSLHEGTEERF